jgi:RNA polymerase sigma-70 factor (ECF subfamily)
VAWTDQESFAAFHGRTARGLWSYVYRVTNNAADADDIVQDAFCRLVGADVEDLDEDGRRKYVFRIATNIMTDRWRRSARERSWIARVGSFVGTVEPVTPDDDVANVFRRLKPRERALLWLAYVEQDSHEEIAGALGISRGSVKVVLSRARARLRDLLTSAGIMKGSNG